jgi:glycosyltransferase involved in cell wall biosynthesis
MTSRISVVIPAFNSRVTIARALRSTLTQDPSPLEVIVVDDGSDDGTPDVAQSFGEPIKVIRREHKGAASARNSGAEEASGDIIAFLDADDYWYPHKFRSQLPLFDDLEVVAVGSAMHYRDPHGRLLGTLGEAFRQDDLRRAQIMPFQTSSVLVRRQVFNTIRGFDLRLDEFAGGQAEDLDLLSRMTDHGWVSYLSEPLGTVTLSLGSTTALHFREQRLATRYVRALATSRALGQPSPDPAAFRATYKPTFASRYGDTTQYWYRRASRNLAGRKYGRAALSASIAFLMSPRYAVQRSWRISRRASSRQ